MWFKLQNSNTNAEWSHDPLPRRIVTILSWIKLEVHQSHQGVLCLWVCKECKTNPSTKGLCLLFSRSASLLFDSLHRLSLLVQSSWSGSYSLSISFVGGQRLKPRTSPYCTFPLISMGNWQIGAALFASSRVQVCNIARFGDVSRLHYHGACKFAVRQKTKKRENVALV